MMVPESMPRQNHMDPRDPFSSLRFASVFPAQVPSHSLPHSAPSHQDRLDSSLYYPWHNACPIIIALLQHTEHSPEIQHQKGSVLGCICSYQEVKKILNLFTSGRLSTKIDVAVVDFDDMGGAGSAKNSYEVRSFLEIQDLKAIMG